jgi:AAA domain
MAIDLKQRIMKGKVDRPPRTVIYGAEGVGKSSFAAGAPNVFFLDANQGSFRLNVERAIPESWDETFEWLSAIERGDIKCDNVALDVLSDFENMSHAKLFQGTSISKYEGGYGKGDDVALMEWRRLLYHVERVWLRGKGIIFVAHASVRKFEDPSGPGYERYELAARKPVAALLKGWSDYVLFARENVVVVSTEKGKPSKATTTGERWLYTKRTPAYDAKARGTMLFPERLPLSWEEFQKAVKNDDARSDEMKRELDTMLAEIADKAYEKQVREWLAQYPSGLVDAFNRVQIRFNDKKSDGDAEKKPAPAAA